MVDNGQWDTSMASTLAGADTVRGAGIARRTYQAMARRHCVRRVEGEGSKVMGTVEDELLLHHHGRDGRLTFGTVFTVQVLPRFEVVAHMVEL
jgi:hypothetical protein